MKKELNSYAFIDEKDNMDSEVGGKAYGFFYCGASRQEIEAELPTICELAQVPSRLELSLIENTDTVMSDEKLMALASEAKQGGLNYILQANYPNGTNRGAANEVAAILNQAYQSSLYEKNAPFIGEVIYEKNGNYVFMD